MPETCTPGPVADCVPVCETEVRIDPRLTPEGTKLAGSLGYGFELEKFIDSTDPGPVLLFQVDGAIIHGTDTLLDQNERVVYVDKVGAAWVNLNTLGRPNWVRTWVFEPSAYTAPKPVQLGDLTEGKRFRFAPGGDVWAVADDSSDTEAVVELVTEGIAYGRSASVDADVLVYPEGGV